MGGLEEDFAKKETKELSSHPWGMTPPLSGVEEGREAIRELAEGRGNPSSSLSTGEPQESQGPPSGKERRWVQGLG